MTTEIICCIVCFLPPLFIVYFLYSIKCNTENILYCLKSSASYFIINEKGQGLLSTEKCRGLLHSFVSCKNAILTLQCSTNGNAVRDYYCLVNGKSII